MSQPKVKLQKYLRRQAVIRPLNTPVHNINKTARAVIIPAMAESEHLPRTLASLEQNYPLAAREQTIVLVIVNQPCGANIFLPAKDLHNISILEDNQTTLAWLAAHQNAFSFQLRWIDAANPGCQMPPDTGVGRARRIGADSLLSEIYEPYSTHPAPRSPEDLVMLHLDADTLVGQNYIEVASHGIRAAGTDGGVVNYQHQMPDNPETAAAIAAYEKYLRYVVDGLRFASSPYAYHTIGSTMVCTAAGYIKAGGIPIKRQAGEDFYFLQQLAKTGGIAQINQTRVYPAARISSRNPYGTGPAVQKIMKDGVTNYRVYAPECFMVLKEWLDTVRQHLDANPNTILNSVAQPVMREFVAAKGFAQAWRGLQHHHPDPARRLKAFHEWFDALATIRLLRHLTRTCYEPVPLPVARHTLASISKRR